MHRPTRLALAALSVTALVATVAPAPATATPPVTGTGTVIASGLNSPRHLSFGAGKSLYVAEAGTGGDGPCAEGAEGKACFGLTGSITQINRFGQKRVVKQLPSLAAEDGSGATGPTDVDVRDNRVAIVLGLGGNADFRGSFGPAADTLGTLQTGRLGRRLTTAADLVAYEQTKDPDKAGPDSNPGGFVAVNAKSWVIADAGGNDLVAAGKRGEPRVAATFRLDRTAPAPSAGPWGPAGTPIAFQSVPTDVVKGPDGALYVSELNGFPFPPGASTIWRVVPGKKPQVYATGLTSVTSLDWRGKQLYAVQIFDGPFFDSLGSVRKVVRGSTSHPAVAEGLPTPYGIAIKGDSAYVTTGSVLKGGGEVREIPLKSRRG